MQHSKTHPRPPGWAMRDCFFVAGTPPAYQEFSFSAKLATDGLARTDMSGC